MSPLTTPRLVLKRLTDDWIPLSITFAGITIATTLIAAAPIYLNALERLSLNQAIDGLGRQFSNVNAFAFNTPLTPSHLDETSLLLEEAINQHLSPIYEGRERYLTVDTYLAGLPDHPLPDPTQSSGQASLGYLRSFSNLEDHVTVLAGRLAGNAVRSGPRGPLIEAVVGPTAAELFGLRVDDVVTLTPDIGAPTRISIEIVGIVDAVNPTADYWIPHASFFLDPPAPEDTTELPVGVELEIQSEERPLPLFVTQEALVHGVGQAYPGTVIDSLWFIRVDTEPLKEWSVSDILRRLGDFEADVNNAMPGSDVFTGITKMVHQFERTRFFFRVPLLLLLAATVVTVLLFLFMVVSNLAQDRERDGALLKTRGVGTLQVMRLYGLEGLVMAVVAVLLAPFLAMGLVALAGVLPYFSGITGGGLLPVELGPAPFFMATGAGLVCLAIYVVPSVLGARGGLLAHKLRASRPPTLPFFHRYYMDVAVLVLGGLAFWELSSRGQFISGGLFQEQGVNEKLLLAPVLFLIVVALVFIRFFPLVVRFMSGESPALLHLTFAVTLLVLGPGIALRETREGSGSEWLGPVALLVPLAWAYWATHHTGRRALRAGGLVIQIGLVAGVVALERPETGEALFAPTVVLMAMVPAQVAYLLLRVLTRKSPVWLSVGMWHMARNPLQYTWLVLLLVLVTGVGILSTTVGGTLARSREDRIQYNIAADVHVSNIPRFLAGGATPLKNSFLNISGVTSASLAFRGTAGVGPSNVQILALESRDFPYVSSWFRDDFSTRPLGALMGALRSQSNVERLEIPEGATAIGIWARPEEAYPHLSMWIAIEDSLGTLGHLDMGDLVSPDWQMMRSAIPSRLRPPLHLVSVQVYESGPKIKTPGSLLLDDIHVTVGLAAEEQMLEDFEGHLRWTPIVVSALTRDRLLLIRDPSGTDRAVAFQFGQESDRGYRGLYLNPSGGPVPVVVNSAFVEATGTGVGDTFVANLGGRRVPMAVRETVHYFPTMTTGGDGFILADLDAILRHLNILDSPYTVNPNEIFLKVAAASQQTVLQDVRELVRSYARVDFLDTQLGALEQDPLALAGWSSMVVLSLVTILLATGLGYATYLLSFASRGRSEMGFLQSMGLSRRQLAGLLAFEQLSIVVMGLGLGTWAGFQLGDLMVSPLAVTETGQEVVPPFVLVTDWSLMLPTYAALMGIFVAALYMLNRSTGRLDMRAISREEGI